MTREPTGPVTPPPHDGPPPHPDESASDELSPDEEPTTTGTLFIMVLFLMALAGMWGIMYFTLLSR
ncbi:MAG: hypothetical protein P8177_07995 [Gemmatimonadota bacterium]|jgi:hypothetical protein